MTALSIEFVAKAARSASRAIGDSFGARWRAKGSYRFADAS